jgi:hypothetical protein
MREDNASFDLIPASFRIFNIEIILGAQIPSKKKEKRYIFAYSIVSFIKGIFVTRIKVSPL